MDYQTLARHQSGSIADIIGETTRDYIALELVLCFTLLGERYRKNNQGQDKLEKFFLSPATNRVYSLHFVNDTDCHIEECV